MRQRKADEVLVAARRVFLERGYDATSVDDVAVAAGVSKATVYSNFRDKDALLAAMIDRVTAEAELILARAVAPLDEDGPVRDRLMRAASLIAYGVLVPEVIQLRRLAISSAVEFPVSAAQYWTRGPAATIAMLRRHFQAMADRQELAITDVAGAASRFAYALVGPLQDRAMFDPGFAPSKAEIARQVTATVDEFLRSSA
jgi:TetR/AcrR family transcriptional regulator, mexJK operon transcriptional repressor